MTCIVAVEHEGAVWMGGDSWAGDDEKDQRLIASPKVISRGPMLLGSSGGFRAAQVFQYLVPIPDHPQGLADEEYMCTVFAEGVRAAMKGAGLLTVGQAGEAIADGIPLLCGYRGRVYLMEPNFGIIRNTLGYEAIGCGTRYAMGALYAAPRSLTPYDRIKLALEAAEMLNAGVKSPFMILRGGAL